MENVAAADALQQTQQNYTKSHENNQKSRNPAIGAPKELHLHSTNKCYVINNSFSRDRNLSLKQQYDIDEREIGKTFSWLNFDVKVKRDVNYTEMEKFFRGMALKDHTDKECIVFFILSHGTEDGSIVTSDRRKFSIDSMIEKVQNIETLVQKPKLFFIQACRGAQDMDAVEVEVKTAGIQTKTRVAKKSNSFVYYSTMQGNRSYSSTKTGSFFVDILCQVLMEYHRNVNVRPPYHFNDITTTVNDLLSQHVRDFVLDGEEELKSLVQVSEVRSSLCQNIYFYPSQKNFDASPWGGVGR